MKRNSYDWLLSTEGKDKLARLPAPVLLCCLIGNLVYEPAAFIKKDTHSDPHYHTTGAQRGTKDEGEEEERTDA